MLARHLCSSTSLVVHIYTNTRPARCVKLVYDIEGKYYTFANTLQTMAIVLTSACSIKYFICSCYPLPLSLDTSVHFFFLTPLDPCIDECNYIFIFCSFNIMVDW